MTKQSGDFLNTKINTRFLFLLCGITFLAKLLLLFFFVDTISLWEDNDIAVNIVKTGEFKYFHNYQWNYNYNFPVYPYIVSFIYTVFGINAKYVIVYHLILQVFTAYFLFHSFYRFLTFFDHKSINNRKEQIAFIAVACFLLHPLITYYALGNIFPFTQSLFFVSASFYFMFRLFEKWNTKNLILYSLFLGLAVVDRSTAVTVTLPFLLFCFYTWTFRHAIKKIAIVAAISVLPLCLWVVRNYQVTGHVQLTSSMGENLWLGIQEETEGTTQMQDGRSYYFLLQREDIDQLLQLDAAGQNEYYMKKYFSECKNDPGKIAGMFFVKMKNFWWFRTSIGLSYNADVNSLIPYYKIVYALILFLSVAGIFIIGKKSIFLWSYLLGLSIMQSLVYVEMRHRIIIEPWLIFFAVITVYWLWFSFFKTRNNELPKGA